MQPTQPSQPLSSGQSSPVLYTENEPLNKRAIQRKLNLTYYYVDQAIELLRREGSDMRPTVQPGRGNEKLFTPEQIRAIQRKVQEMIDERR